MLKIGVLFKEHHLFRRLAFCMIFYITYNLTVWSYEYAYHAVEKGEGGVAIAATITAIAAPVTLLIGFISKIYSDSRKP